MSYLDSLVEKSLEEQKHINASGLHIIKQFEGWSATPYRCPANIPTQGWGFTRLLNGSKVKMDSPALSKEEAEVILKHELNHFERGVRRLVNVKLNHNQFSSLVSFSFNLGLGNLQNSTLRMKLNRDDYDGAADEFPKWRKAGGRILKGLVRRRAAERSLFLA
jgi:lysozyme